MNLKPIVKPQESQLLSRGNITDIYFENNIHKITNGYAFRFIIYFEDGSNITKQKGPFKTRKECIELRNDLIKRYPTHAYSFFDKVKISEVFLYWLYYYKVENGDIRSYNSFTNYRNIIENYIIPELGDRKMCSVTYKMLMDFFDSIKSKSILKQMIAVVYMVFNFANERYILHNNPAIRACADKKAILLLSQKHEMKKQRKTLTLDEARLILGACQEEFPEFFIPLAFSITMGLRISEIIGVKYSDIDFKNSTLNIKRQLGHPLIFSEEAEEESCFSENKTETIDIMYGNKSFSLDTVITVSIEKPTTDKLCTQELLPKSISGIRKIPIPKVLLDRILIQYEQYSKRKISCEGFHDLDFVWCHDDGTPYNSTGYQPYFKPLLEKCGLQGFTFHDMRHTYATILFDNDISVKAISKVLGHSKASMTYNVYIEKHVNVVDILPYINDTIEELLPKPKIYDIVFLDTTIHALI